MIRLFLYSYYTFILKKLASEVTLCIEYESKLFFVLYKPLFIKLNLNYMISAVSIM